MSTAITPTEIGEGPYRTLFEHSLDAVLFTVPDGRILAANPAACRIFRASEEEICRRGRQGFSDERDPRWTAVLEERRRTGQVTGVLPMVRADGSRFFAELSSAVFAGEVGERRTCVILRDVTDRVQLEHRLRASNEITRALLAGEETTEVLGMIARHARAIVDGTEAGVVTPGEEPGSVVVVAADGRHMPGLVGRRYGPGSLAAEVMAARQSLVVSDLTSAAAEEDGRRLGVGPAVIVPIVAGDAAFGNLIVGSEPGRGSYDEEEVSVLGGLAEAAAVALTLGRAREQAERASLLAEQSRIATDLHNKVIQHLFATGLGLQSVADLVPPAVASRLHESVDSLDEIIAEVRRTVFGLQASTPRTVGLVPRVHAVVAEVGDRLGVAPVATVSRSIDRLGEEVAAALLVALREMLARVCLKARVSRVEVAVSCVGDAVTMTVTDDGEARPGETDPDHALADVARRAEALGGSFALAVTATTGTRLEWTVPTRPLLTSG